MHVPLINSFYREKPVPDRSIPSWNLALVLDALRKKPFEPLESIPLSHLTLKTVFLLAFSSGIRRGELHALIHKDGANSQMAVTSSILIQSSLLRQLLLVAHDSDHW